MAWRGKAWQGEAWRGEAWHGEARQGLARHGAAWRGLAWRGQARQGKAWLGEARFFYISMGRLIVKSNIGFNKNKVGGIDNYNFPTNTELLLTVLSDSYDKGEEVKPGIKGVTYKKLSEIIEDDIQIPKNFSALGTARKRLQRDRGINTSIIINLGVKFLLGGADIICSARKDVVSISHKTDKALRTLNSAVLLPNKPTNAEMISINAMASGLGALKMLSDYSKMHLLEDKVSATNRIPLSETLDFFRK